MGRLMLGIIIGAAIVYFWMHPGEFGPILKKIQMCVREIARMMLSNP
jgi:hypothetical protein